MQVAGLGCRRDCTASELAQLLNSGLREAGLAQEWVQALATFEGKRDEPGLVQLAMLLQVPLLTFNSHQLTAFEARLSHRSAVAFATTGCWGVAESAALAGATQADNCAHLTLTRRHSSNATLALATSTR